MKPETGKSYKELHEKWFYLIIALLSAYLIIRLIDESNIITNFPFDFTNDISSHMAKLYFLAEFGFRSVVHYWYNGYDLFRFYPPGWFFFTLPIYLILKNVQLSTYISMISIYVLSLTFFLILGKKLDITWKKSILFFLFFLANPIAIGNFLRVGRLPELLSWAFFIPFFTIILLYKDKPIDKKFFLISIIGSLLLLSHQTVFILASSMFISLIIIRIIARKNTGNIYKILLSMLLIVVLTSFWTIPFVLGYEQTSIANYNFSERYFNFSGPLLLESLTSIFVTLSFIIILYMNRKNEKNKRNFYFFLPQLALAIIILTNVIVFIPILNKIHPDAYNTLFIFLSSFLLLKTKFSIKQRKALIISLNLLVVISIIMSITYTPWFIKNNDTDKSTIKLFKSVDGKFVILKSESSYAKAYYSYAPIFYQISTPSGWSHQEISQDYINDIKAINENFEKNDCDAFRKSLKKVNTTEVISYKDNCKKLETCNLKEKASDKDACLYTLKD